MQAIEFNCIWLRAQDALKQIASNDSERFEQPSGVRAVRLADDGAPGSLPCVCRGWPGRMLISESELAFEPDELDSNGDPTPIEAADRVCVRVAAVSAVEPLWRQSGASFGDLAPQMCVCALRVLCDGADEPVFCCCFDWPPLADLALALVQQSTACSASGMTSSTATEQQKPAQTNAT